MKQQQIHCKPISVKTGSKAEQKSTKNIKCTKKVQSNINVDCIKVCPMDSKIWALSFYQQHPQFVGGIQIIGAAQLESDKELKVGGCDGYVQMGPIMHIEWLNTKQLRKNSQNNKLNHIYYLLAAARCDQAIVCSFNQHGVGNKTSIVKRIVLQTGVFCLYCDWRLSLNTSGIQQDDKLSAVAVVSTNQSAVFCFDVSIGEQQTIVGQVQQYTKHEYAVWACKINPSPYAPAKVIAGDQVDCLYLYDAQNRTLVAKNKKAHTQGICEIYWPNQQWILTGSFDGTIAQIYLQNFTQPTKIFKLGGTIWRIIPIIITQCTNSGQEKTQKQELPQFLICNSSQKKFQIFNPQKDGVVWDSSQEHESLAYAADVSGILMVSASFYDQKLRVWQWELKQL